MRLTVNLTPRAAEALDRLASTTETSKTDVVNRALQIYALIEQLAAANDGQLRIVHSDGSVERIYLV
ncbi:hypothetical protein GCM10009557_40350 [Virgisporangium ochraceum]|uniref:Uncharacterized protein n=1 Tax=Virgisporangium ochraceum TaxID=65505 RepID=A0A8J3ZPX4_9ACTN|nr:hypothetical protein [Virgisporangium ochraceum]GIJ67651.1 hypothetical protein Voc01_025680 [Virgisporangium ochraceum]